MYRHTPSYVWVDWEWLGEGDPPSERDYTGFRMRILANPTAAEVRAESASFANWRDLSNLNYGDKDHFQSIADRVVEWEYEIEDAEGNVVAVPAPGEAEGNWEAFFLLPSTLAGWIGLQVHTAHFPKAIAPSSMPAGSTETANPIETSPEPELLTS